MYSMELPTQSGLLSPGLDPCTDSDSDQTPPRGSNRKSNKPLLEKKRRARINKSLDQLKGLVLEALKKDSARYSKLEKADILEMTVKHLREVQRHQMSVAMSVDPSVISKFRSGFGECAHEVDRYLSTIDGLSSEVRLRLMQHLSGCATGPQIPTSYPNMARYPGVPSGSPPHLLPGMNMRCGMPFGGLAVSSSSPDSTTHPVSQQQAGMLYGAHGYRVTRESQSPNASPRCQPAVKQEPPVGYSKKDNTENIAPVRNQRPLAEKHNNSNLPTSTWNDLGRANHNNNSGISHSNNNNSSSSNNSSSNSREFEPPTKKAKLDTVLNYRQLDNRVENLEMLAMNIKMEAVWRPW